MMFPTMLRYAALFSVYYTSAIGNITYRVKNLPEWASMPSTPPSMPSACSGNPHSVHHIPFVGGATGNGLSYIVVFPLVAILIFATIISENSTRRQATSAGILDQPCSHDDDCICHSSIVCLHTGLIAKARKRAFFNCNEICMFSAALSRIGKRGRKWYTETCDL